MIDAGCRATRAPLAAIPLKPIRFTAIYDLSPWWSLRNARTSAFTPLQCCALATQTAFLPPFRCIASDARHAARPARIIISCEQRLVGWKDLLRDSAVHTTYSAENRVGMCMNDSPHLVLRSNRERSRRQWTATQPRLLALRALLRPTALPLL